MKGYPFLIDIFFTLLQDQGMSIFMVSKENLFCYTINYMYIYIICIIEFLRNFS